ncbi:MAG: hypothetical protein QM692_18500 [Thermomicrobiales bacterium]
MATDEHIIERLSRNLGHGVSRRQLGGLARLGAAAWALAAIDADAKKKKKKKKRKKKPAQNPGPTPPTTSPPTGCTPACGAGTTCVNGVCVSTANVQALINATAAGGTVTLPAGTSLLSSTLVIDRDLTLRGAGAGQTILDGAHAVRVLTVNTGATVIVEDLTITNGMDGPSSDYSSGGITNLGTLTLRGVRITNCEGDWVGGIYNVGFVGVLHLYDTTVRDNTSSSTGGILSGERASLTLHEGCVISGNSGRSGGGLRSFKSTTSMTGTRISGNSAERGAGIYNYESSVTIGDGCVVGGDTPADANTATSYGGGILNQGTVVVESGAKVVGNSASQGGGAYNDAFRASLTFKAGSRVSGNTATTGAAIWNDAGSTVIESGALVCGNTPNNQQCGTWTGSITGACPVSGGTCPA